MADPAALSPADLAAELDGVLRPLTIELSHAWWEMNTHSSPEAERRQVELELRRREELSDRARYEAVSAAAGAAGDPIVGRVLDVVAKAMGPNMVDDELRRQLVELETKIESTFVNHRGEIDGRRVNDNDIEQVLVGSDDSEERRKAWAASKTVGAAVADDLLALVRLRNEAARRLGFTTHYEMALRFNDLDESRLFATLDDVERASQASFAAWKAGLDERLATRFGCGVDDLRPWHYDDPFFQEPPVTGRVTLDDELAGADLEALTLRTYEGMGLDIRPALGRSDLVSRDGKNQHAFCISIDREDDVRVLSNNVPNEKWMGTMLHEFGHAIYDLEIDRSLPYLIRQPAHTLATEAVAMLFGRLVRDEAWLSEAAGVTADPAVTEAQRVAMLVFARWVLVMCHFERGLYADPDADHDTRWWDLVERFQLVRRPEEVPPGGWASKIHLAVAPVYYQNYLYGELMASQLTAALQRDVGGLVDRRDAGAWLVDRIFRPGASKRWDHLLADATGEPLNVAHFVREFCS
jgi:peptidyl-dipeptidase A